MNERTKTFLKIIVPLIISLLFYLIPFHGLTENAHRVGSFFIVAALYWVLETVPIYTTSLIIMFMELVFLSNKTIPFLRPELTDGQFLTVNQIYGAFSSPIIILFLGGLFLARSATKYKLDANLARVILKPFGTKSGFVLAALMMVTALFSMFMSNTATTAMMLAIVFPIVATLPSDDNLGKALVLAVPIAANIGGIGTPIGTPPNAVALAALEKIDLGISFGAWMVLGIPYVIVMLGFSWFALRFLFPSKTSDVVLEMKGSFDKSLNAIIVYIVFGTTIALWVTTSMHKLPSTMIAFLPIVVLSITGIMDKKELRNISWDVLWLISGGLALGLAMKTTGFDVWCLSLIPFASFSPQLIIVGIAVVGLLMSTFISNTATANLLIPMVISLLSIFPDGSLVLPVVLAFSCSMAMALPISTPPNALAFGTGFINSRDLLKVGSIVSIVGIIVALIFASSWQSLGIL